MIQFFPGLVRILEKENVNRNNIVMPKKIIFIAYKRTQKKREL